MVMPTTFIAFRRLSLVAECCVMKLGVASVGRGGVRLFAFEYDNMLLFHVL